MNIEINSKAHYDAADCFVFHLKKKGFGLFVLTLFVFAVGMVTAQDSVKTKNMKILPVPSIGYSPETKTYIGAVTLVTFNHRADTSVRTSNFKVEVNYTWNKQLILETGWNSFLSNEKWFTKGLLHYSHYPDYYYGVGSAAPKENKTLYNSNRFVADVYALKKIAKNMFGGLNLRLGSYKKVEPENNSIAFDELINAEHVGAGLSFLNDSRNNILTPTRGFFVMTNLSYNFSSLNYTRLTADARYYKTWKNNITFSSRFVHVFTFGTPPFYDYAYLGGDQFVRGFYYGRYRDKNLGSLQAEFRMPVFWRIGAAFFGGGSNLYSHAAALSTAATKFNYGMGLRFLVDKKDKTNLRLDYAMGSNGNSGFYIAFGESF
ncbi:MAG: BamA/TamA family outer membrane protein [Lacibacter sp.]